MSVLYTPLHVHSSRGSLLDSTNTPDSLIDKAREYGLTSIALTDHGTISNHVEFYKKCKDNDIKPILGMEGYIALDMTIQEREQGFFHIILLAKDKQGYRNLLKLTSIAQLEGFYYKPRIDLKTIKERGLGKGIIASSACLGGQAPQMILNDSSREDIIKLVQEYQSCFDEFYLELQGTSFDIDEQSEKQFKVNEALYKLANELDIPLIVTSDSHYTDKEDYQLHNIFIQISQNRDNEVYKDCWLKSPQEMLEQNYGDIPQEVIAKAMQNTMDIADKCNVELELGHGYVPTAKLPSGFSNVESYFSKLVVDGCKKRGFDKFIGGKKKIYWDRIKEEYHVMKEKGFLHYFILLYDILNEASKRGLVTSPSARGSGASSLICYALGITNVDPIKHGLIFERFLTIEKKGLPD